jgi:hypothetical protein
MLPCALNALYAFPFSSVNCFLYGLLPLILRVFFFFFEVLINSCFIYNRLTYKDTSNVNVLLPGTPLNGNSTTISASAAIAAASAAVTPTKSSLTTLPTLVSVAGTSVSPGRVWQKGIMPAYFSGCEIA